MIIITFTLLQVSLAKRLDDLNCDDLLHNLQLDYSSLWRRIQGGYTLSTSFVKMMCVFIHCTSLA